MSEIRVGDRVWAFSTRKWGKVIDTDSCHSATAMEFEVEFEDGSTSWHGFDDLFFEEIVIPPSARTRPTPKHEFKPGDVVLAEGFAGQPELRVFVRSDVGSAVLRNLGTPSYDYEQALSRVKPYDRTLLGFDAVEEIRLGESKIRPVFTVEEGDNG